MRAWGRAGVGVALLAGCDLRGGASLAELQMVPFVVTAQGNEPRITVALAGPELGEAGCVRISDRIHASLDGADMRLGNIGTWHDTGPNLNHQAPYCDVANFELGPVMPMPIGQTSTIVVADDDMQWSMTVRDLLSSYLVFDPLVATPNGFELGVTWPAAAPDTIYYLSGQELRDDASALGWQWWGGPSEHDPAVTVTNNHVSIAMPRAIDRIYFEADRDAVVDSCSAPAGCAATASTAVEHDY